MDLISDIHLEFDPTFRLNRIGEILIIAGDLGKVVHKSYLKFLTDASERYDHIILVAGNHEYYNTSIENGERLLREIKDKLPNVHYLQCESIIINKVEFLGCTLWSDISNIDKWMTNDGASIKDFSLNKYYELYQSHSAWLSDKLNTPSNHKRVVVTHYLPTYKVLDPKYDDNPTNAFFASDLDHLIPKATLWVAGHTHKDNTIMVGGTYLYVNPKGYPGENNESYTPLEI